MKSEIKILHAQYKRAKNGELYQLLHVLIKIGKHEFIRKFYLFDNHLKDETEAR